MTLVFFLKTLTDLCYYLGFACFIGSSYGLKHSLIPAAILLALSAALSRMLWEKQPALRFFPMLLWAGLLLLPAEPAGWVVLLPPALYLIWIFAGQRYTPEYAEAVDLFFLLLKILPLPILLALLLGQAGRLEAFSFPYNLIFLFGSVLLLRMLRHDEQTMCSLRFRVMNSLALIGVLALSVFLCSNAVKAAVSFVFSWLYRVVGVTVFMGLAGLLMGAALVMEKALSGLHLEGHFQERQQTEEDLLGQLDPQKILPPEIADENPIGIYIISVLLLIGIILLAIFLFRRLASGKKRTHTAPGITVRSSITPADSPKKEPPLTRLTARTPVQQVRYWYQQLIVLSQRTGAQPRRTMDTEELRAVEDTVFPDTKPQHDRLRKLYLRARYALSASPEDAKEAHALYQTVSRARRAADKKIR